MDAGDSGLFEQIKSGVAIGEMEGAPRLDWHRVCFIAGSQISPANLLSYEKAAALLRTRFRF
jgi:hypothetical protein